LENTTSFARDNGQKRRAAQIDTLIGQVEGLTGPAAEQVAQLAHLVLDMHRDGLKRILREVAQAPQGGEALVHKLAQDPLVADLLLLHDLHPIGQAERVAAAVEKLRPYLQSHGGDVELLGLNDGRAQLRMSGNGGACPTLRRSLMLTIEKEVYDAAPDLAGINIEAAEPTPTPGGAA
jgi:Fe-S cluster biogenesis protein NfuA